MEELMLVNPEGAGQKRHRRKAKGKVLIGRFTGKHVAGALGGAAATIAIPKAAGLKDWGDVIGSGAVAIGGRRFSAAQARTPR
jgi:hypothetical protein